MIFILTQAILLLAGGVSAIGETCTTSIDRLRKGPEMYTEVIAAGNTYEDASFNGRDTLYWLAFSELTKVRDYETNLWWGEYSF
jgi:hypothetical protein